MTIRRRDLRASRLMGDGAGEGNDPMSSMGNLMDVMLVFACGLMIALITHYNVNLTPSDPDVGQAEKLDAELEMVQQGVADGVTDYSELGTVYVDNKTGELYVVSPEQIDAEAL